MNNETIVNKRYLFNQFEPLLQEVIGGILNITLKNKFITVSRHSNFRSIKKKINMGRLINCLKNNKYRIVEVNIKDNEVRCLVRTEALNGSEIVASIVLFEGIICTCWENSVEDNHPTLNKSMYETIVNVDEIFFLFNHNFELVKN